MNENPGVRIGYLEGWKRRVYSTRLSADSGETCVVAQQKVCSLIPLLTLLHYGVVVDILRRGVSKAQDYKLKSFVLSFLLRRCSPYGSFSASENSSGFH